MLKTDVLGRVKTPPKTDKSISISSMIIHYFQRLAMTVAYSATLTAFWDSSSYAALEQAKTLDIEQREVDELLAKVDSVELRKASPRILQLAERLLREKGDAAAQRYFEKGLEGNPWALEQQLTLGEILARSGQSNALREKVEMVLRVGEEDEVLKRASRLAGRDLPEQPISFSEIKEQGIVLVLLPIGPVSVFTLHDLRAGLAKRLGVKVIIASLEVPIAQADRTAKMQWVKRTREQVLKAVKEQPALAAQLGNLGFTYEQIETNDEALETLIRKTTEMEQGAVALQALDATLTQYEQAMQWDAARVIGSLQSSAGTRAGPKKWVLGVTPHDLFGGTSNFLFGAASTGSFLGVISTHRFRAVFNDEPPKRERFNERLLKQSLSTIGFMIGVPRCTTPECARAYPQSLTEHDQKPSTLCPSCRADFETALRKKLPQN